MKKYPIFVELAVVKLRIKVKYSGLWNTYFMRKQIGMKKNDSIYFEIENGYGTKEQNTEWNVKK